MKEEEEIAIKCHKSGKVPGIHNITAEMMEAAKVSSVEVLHALFQKIY